MALHAVKRLGGLAKYFPRSRSFLATGSKSAFQSSGNARTITRSLFFMSRSRDSSAEGRQVKTTFSNRCSCGCSLHTKGDQELAAFLEEEIKNETKSLKSSVLSELEGFHCKYNGSEVTLTKTMDQETVSVIANVNHSVDAEDVADPSEAKEGEVAGEMKSKPDFRVEISKGKKILAFECSFTVSAMEGGGEEEAYNDSFQITEITMYEGDDEENTYSVAGDIMDGYLYDLLMNYLEERGISNDFADKLVKAYTFYEHKLYVGLLQNMKKFVEK